MEDTALRLLLVWEAGGTTSGLPLAVSEKSVPSVKPPHMAISKKLRLDGESLVSVFFTKGTIEEADKYFNALSNKLVSELYPELVGHLERIKAHDQVHSCKTVEQLEALHFDLLPADLHEKLAGALDKIKELTDTERCFALARIGQALFQASYDHVQDFMQQRAQALELQKDMDREKYRPSRIITNP